MCFVCLVMGSAVVPSSDPLRSLVEADFPEEVPPPRQPKRHCYQTTNEQRQIIVTMYANGKSAKKIAEEVNIPYTTVRSVIHVYRTKHRIHKLRRHVRTSQWTTEQKDALVRWQIRHADWTYKQLRQRFCRKYPHVPPPGIVSIHRILKTHPPKPFTEKMLYKVPAGMSCYDMSCHVMLSCYVMLCHVIL